MTTAGCPAFSASFFFCSLPPPLPFRKLNAALGSFLRCTFLSSRLVSSSCRLPQDPQEATAAVQAWIWPRSSEGGVQEATEAPERASD